MKIAYWVVASLLALLYLYAGGKKVSQSKEQLEPMMQWVDATPMWLVRSIGVLELLGAAGLVVPPAAGIVPSLAIVAAIGFVVLQALATGLHLSRGEGLSGVGINVVLFVLAVVGVWLATVW
jgi:hypothetical protein